VKDDDIEGITLGVEDVDGNLLGHAEGEAVETTVGCTV
jgi:hypothetical protein